MSVRFYVNFTLVWLARFRWFGFLLVFLAILAKGQNSVLNWAWPIVCMICLSAYLIKVWMWRIKPVPAEKAWETAIKIMEPRQAGEMRFPAPIGFSIDEIRAGVKILRDSVHHHKISIEGKSGYWFIHFLN